MRERYTDTDRQRDVPMIN